MIDRVEILAIWAFIAMLVCLLFSPIWPIGLIIGVPGLVYIIYMVNERKRRIFKLLNELQKDIDDIKKDIG